jgi:hypothetical protein
MLNMPLTPFDLFVISGMGVVALLSAIAVIMQLKRLFPPATNMIRNTSGHRWGNPKRLMNAAEVVVHEVQRNRVHVILDPL